MTTIDTNTHTSANNRYSSVTLAVSLNLSINHIIVELTGWEHSENVEETSASLF